MDHTRVRLSVDISIIINLQTLRLPTNSRTTNSRTTNSRSTSNKQTSSRTTSSNSVSSRITSSRTASSRTVSLMFRPTAHCLLQHTSSFQTIITITWANEAGPWPQTNVHKDIFGVSTVYIIYNKCISFIIDFMLYLGCYVILCYTLEVMYYLTFYDIPEIL
ncbi:B1-hordein [Biomphalaria glabrata]|nr:B1-hordein [Biomphalaria glabrata]